jgi:hypothetical protein
VLCTFGPRVRIQAPLSGVGDRPLAGSDPAEDDRALGVDDAAQHLRVAAGGRAALPTRRARWHVGVGRPIEVLEQRRELFQGMDRGPQPVLEPLFLGGQQLDQRVRVADPAREAEVGDPGTAEDPDVERPRTVGAHQARELLRAVAGKIVG